MYFAVLIFLQENVLFINSTIKFRDSNSIHAEQQEMLLFMI
jgi:hypothetical protein